MDFDHLFVCGQVTKFDNSITQLIGKYLLHLRANSLLLELTYFQNGVSLQEINQEVINLVSLVKNGGQFTRDVHSAKWSSIGMATNAQRGKMALMSYANCGLDKHAHPCSLISAFSVRRLVLQYQLIVN